MTTVIKSGDSGYKAKVNSDNRILVHSESLFSEEVKAHGGSAFIFHAECHTAAAASGGLMYFTNNDVDRHFHVSRIYFDAHSLSQSIIIKQIKNPATLVGGSNITTNTSYGVINKNFLRSDQAQATLVVSDAAADMTYSGGKAYHSFPIKTMSSVQRDMKGTNVITSTKTILWGWETLDGSNAVDGEKISLSVNGYWTAV